VWTPVPVPGTSVAGTPTATAAMLIAGANGAFRFDGFRMASADLSATTDR
jgi:hypothetical protein